MGERVERQTDGIYVSLLFILLKIHNTFLNSISRFLRRTKIVNKSSSFPFFASYSSPTLDAGDKQGNAQTPLNKNFPVSCFRLNV
jgi:hypothetical protein